MLAARSADLISLARQLRLGEIHPLAYLDQLEAQFEAVEPRVRAFLPEPGRFSRLRMSAQALLDQYPIVKDRPPIFAVPVGIKDIFHAGAFVTRAGSSLPADLLQGPQAKSVSRLVDAGALVLGKTVTTEFAYFHPGPTRNPHNPAHTPGGSSSGSAAAVASGLATLTLGTQTIGSIIRPAAYCGVAGFKPSYDRIPRDGVIPLAPSVDHVGVFANRIGGVSLAASVLCDVWQPQAPAGKPVLGIPVGPYLQRAGPEALDVFGATHRRLVSAGYEVRSVPVMENFLSIEKAHQTLVAAEASEVHARWFAEYGSLYHRKTAELIRRGQAVSSNELGEAQAGALRFRSYLTSVMEKEGLDLWISPPAPGPAPVGLNSTGDPVMNLPWTYSGLPVVSFPVSRSAGGLPLGLQITGSWYADELLLAWASGIEDILMREEV